MSIILKASERNRENVCVREIARNLKRGWMLGWVGERNRIERENQESKQVSFLYIIDKYSYNTWQFDMKTRLAFNS